MKIYFDYSGRAVDKHGKIFSDIYHEIERNGHTNLRPLTSIEYRENLYSTDHESKVAHFRATMANIKKCDVLVIEVSEHSLSMGYLMHKALESGKPVIALHLKGHEPVFAMGIESEKLQVLEYSAESISTVLKHAIDFASETQDTRFNFFISPKHQSYLDWICRSKKVPRSVYLRDLIDEDMKNNPEYSSAS
ncbi:MAG: hypothetical protein ACOZAN_05090 [Patescibacteria group bacterium]